MTETHPYWNATTMPGCLPFVLFPRVKAYTQVNMMWDYRGNPVPRNGPSSPQSPPGFPVPSPGISERPMRERNTYPSPVIPLGLPPVPAPSPYVPRPRSSSVNLPRASPRIAPSSGSRPPSNSLRGPRQPTQRVPSRGSQPFPGALPPSVSMPRAPVAYQQTPSRSHHQTPSRSHHQTLRQKPPPLQQSTQHNQAPYRRPAPRPPVSTQPQKYLQRPGSQLSNCTGKKKALCIGINYKGQARPLRGCINDVKNVKIFLTRYWGYRDGDIVMLIDDTENPRQMPTRQNILDGMAWLVKGAKPHDSLFFHYSGHGGQTPDKDGDEVDGYDQVIYPVDHKRAGFILDDEMHRIMVKSLPPHCRLTAVFDSCHSGTALDLPYIYHSNGRLKGSHVTSQARAYKSTQADVVSWCGCRDDQTSADTFQGGVAVGAMSYAFATSLSRNPNQSYQELLRSIREILKSRYSQKPQLSSSHPIDTNLRFIL